MVKSYLILSRTVMLISPWQLHTESKFSYIKTRLGQKYFSTFEYHHDKE